MASIYNMSCRMQGTRRLEGWKLLTLVEVQDAWALILWIVINLLFSPISNLMKGSVGMMILLNEWTDRRDGFGFVLDYVSRLEYLTCSRIWQKC